MTALVRWANALASGDPGHGGPAADGISAQLSLHGPDDTLDYNIMRMLGLVLFDGLMAALKAASA